MGIQCQIFSLLCDLGSIESELNVYHSNLSFLAFLLFFLYLSLYFSLSFLCSFSFFFSDHTDAKMTLLKGKLPYLVSYGKLQVQLSHLFIFRTLEVFDQL